MDRRGSGILLHITSLPSPYGIGDLGPGAYRFADFLREAKQCCWQVLPLNPIDPAFGCSPYSSISAMAGNVLLISPDLLLEEGFLEPREVEPRPEFSEHRCDYAKVIPYKERLYEKAYERFKVKRKDGDEFQAFCSRHGHWLEDYALFVVLKKRHQGAAWSRWPKALKDRDPDALERVRVQEQQALEKEKFLQYLFFRQWFSLKERCEQKGIHLIGDLSIYVSFDSVDVWSSPHLFKLDEEKRPISVSGVPPDYFSKTGQLWGNPVYRWDALQAAGFQWWITRLAHYFDLFDAVRIDHFRGLVAYWEVPAGEKTAVHGRWVAVPTDDFFATLARHFQRLPLIAEDLGFITSEVREVLGRLGFPGMKVLLFAFGEDNPMHPYLPHTYERNAWVYTGTHDNNTVRGWLEKEATPDEKERLFRYIGRSVSAKQIHWEMIRLGMMSVANRLILPMQDVLGLGEEARMNRPSVAHGNWRWRLLGRELTRSLARKLGDMTATYGRA